MKRLLLLFAVTFAFATTLFSQEFYGGLILGGTVSQIGGDSRGGYHKAGIVGGAFAGLNISDDFDIQMELKYIQKGSYSGDLENDPLAPFRIKLDYVDLPVVVSYNLNKININGVNLRWLKLEAGLSLDVLINFRQDIRGETVPETADPWRRLVANTVLGVRFCVNDDIELGLRTINAMTSICNPSKSPNYDGNVSYVQRLLPYYGMFNDVLQLSVFWKL